MEKEPVVIDGECEIDGYVIEPETLTFWADTFRYEDVLRYQDGDVQLMIETPETTTYELHVEATDYPEIVEDSLRSGDRFSIEVECEYFDLNVDTARTEDKSGDTVTIVAEVPWSPL